MKHFEGIREEQLGKECDNKHGESFNIDEMEGWRVQLFQFLYVASNPVVAHFFIEENQTIEGNQVYDIQTNQSNENEEGKM